MSRRKLGFSIIFLVGLLIAPVQAQRSGGFFLEPEVRTTQFFHESATFVGLRLGDDFDDSNFSYDFGFDILASPSFPGGAGPQTLVTVRQLGRVSVAIRYNSLIREGLHYDVGAVFATGLSDGEVRPTRDVRSSPGPYVGARPEVGFVLGMVDELGVRFNAGYGLGTFMNAPGDHAISLGVGIRVRP